MQVTFDLAMTVRLNSREIDARKRRVLDSGYRTVGPGHAWQ